MLSFLIVKTSCGDETSGLRFARVVMVLPGAAFLLACLLACRSRLDFQIFQMEKTRNCNFVLSLSHTRTLSLFCFLISLTFTHTLSHSHFNAYSYTFFLISFALSVLSISLSFSTSLYTHR